MDQRRRAELSHRTRNRIRNGRITRRPARAHAVAVVRTRHRARRTRAAHALLPTGRAAAARGAAGILRRERSRRRPRRPLRRRRVPSMGADGQAGRGRGREAPHLLRRRQPHHPAVELWGERRGAGD